ncbi:hypothetical protein PSPO01_05779 [Paraphaeosphaeria sporulosa]
MRRRAEGPDGCLYVRVPFAQAPAANAVKVRVPVALVRASAGGRGHYSGRPCPKSPWPWSPRARAIRSSIRRYLTLPATIACFSIRGLSQPAESSSIPPRQAATTGRSRGMARRHGPLTREPPPGSGTCT